MNLTIDEIEAFKQDEDHFGELCNLFFDYLALVRGRTFPPSQRQEIVGLFNRSLVDALSGPDTPVQVRERLSYIYSIRPPNSPRPHLRDSERGIISSFIHELIQATEHSIDRRQRRKIGKITAAHIEELLWRLSR